MALDPAGRSSIDAPSPRVILSSASIPDRRHAVHRSSPLTFADPLLNNRTCVMAEAPLYIHGAGSFSPAARPVRAVAAELGVDASSYRGWEHFCRAGPDQHPSTMGAEAVRRALAAGGGAVASLRLIVYTGVSRDYLPSWSVATEIIRLLGAGSACLGIDLSQGCVGTLVGLELVRSWLASNGGGSAVVVAAERWTETISRVDPAQSRLWAHSDGAGAVLVASSPGPAALAFRGACFASRAELNDHVLIEYGGTRNPVAPPGRDPRSRRLSDRTYKEIIAIYRSGYEEALGAALQRFPGSPSRLVCNQVSPTVVDILRELTGVRVERVVTTGPELGHQGAADVLVGLERLGRLDPGERVAVAASAPYAFGAGIIES
jgi:3-oxoacyl-[acyl-carrier-protein] synthase-3